MGSWKTTTDEKGIKTLSMDNEGKPIWINDDKSEIGVDYGRVYNSVITNMNENKTRREANEALTIKNLELTTELAKLKDVKPNDKTDNKELQVHFENKLTQMKETFDSELIKKQNELEGLLVGNKFASSKFIKDKTILPSDLFQLKFGNRFEVVNGQVQAVGADGNALMSKKSIGELAGFEEAIELIVDNYEYRDQILKGTTQSGGGMNTSTTPSKDVYLSDLTTDTEKVAFQLKYGTDEWKKLIQKGKRPQHG